jgi:mRNA interferase MazF
MVMLRGEVWWASLPDPVGSEPGFRRPVIIVQSDAFNRSGLRTVVVAALTSNVRLTDAPGNVFVPRAASGLSRDSVVNVSQLFTVDRSQLSDRQRKLSGRTMTAIDRGLRLVLDL